jgi:hypothetical protein
MTRFMPGIFAFAGLLASMQLCPLSGAQAAEGAGTAQRIINSVSADLAVGPRNLASSDPVYRDERISADGASRAEIELIDGSKIIVGENSVIDLDRFVLGKGTVKSATINVAKGAFRFISGDAPKGAIKIKTPVSTIGIRGTAFDVYVDADGTTRVVLLSGAIVACSTGSGVCQVLDRACDIVEIRVKGEVVVLPFLRSSQRTRSDEARNYHLTENQNRHARPWRANSGTGSARAALENGQQNNYQGDPPSPPAIFEPD